MVCFYCDIAYNQCQPLVTAIAVVLVEHICKETDVIQKPVLPVVLGVDSSMTDNWGL